ncbi:MAG TPA: hypothetical protein VFM18_02405, partial [Methanosarcina sp.]|nr:hypothetical protein [Methanosarcina sp.]
MNTETVNVDFYGDVEVDYSCEYGVYYVDAVRHNGIELCTWRDIEPWLLQDITVALKASKESNKIPYLDNYGD